MRIAREVLTAELFAEILPLAQKCWHESTDFKADTCAFYGEREFDIEPDLEQYLLLEKAGSLIVLTMREDSLIGYAVGIVHRAMHHRKVLSAFADTLYIEPEHRGHFMELIGRFEREFAEAGAQIIGWPTSPSGPIYPLLKARGYVGDETVMEKRLCVSPLQ